MDTTPLKRLPNIISGLPNQTGISQTTLPNSSLFGTDGIRGKFGEQLTESLATKIGFWAGQILKINTLKSGPVILGQDSRNSSNLLAAALMKGFNTAGVEIWHLGLCPTPAVAYITSISDAIGGVMISASHNPPEDNGIKIFSSDGSKLSQAVQDQIETALQQSVDLAKFHYIPRRQSYMRQELLKNYLLAIQVPLLYEISNSLPLKDLHVVLDLAWGAAVYLAPQAFQRLGAKVTCLHDQPDGDRINVRCGSTHLAALQTAVLAMGADLGFAFDGDADRTLAVDGQGRTVNGDYILYLWGQKLQQQGQLPDNLIVSTVMSNLGFENAWKKRGGKLIRTAVGDQHVYAEMLRSGTMLGGEQSGHILCRHYGVTGDGLVTALHLAALVRQLGLPLAELVDQSFQSYPQQLRNVHIADWNRRMKWQECEELQQVIQQAEAHLGHEGRILVRASGTEPMIRVMVEAVTGKLVDYWTDYLATRINYYLAG